GGMDILVTHAPAKDHGDLPDLPHQGFACFNSLLEICRPGIMVHGHVHASYGGNYQREQTHSCGTRIINAFERYVIDVHSEDFPKTAAHQIRSQLIGSFIK
ncbi:MAG: metallophosphoesterase, partial [Oscillospiraceae bacterium]|nr:metallophosphoesterase [Oscillospiraceae bacterium]